MKHSHSFLTHQPARWAAVVCAILTSHTAWAGRPLNTDDAGTAPAKTCQIETWIEKQAGEHAWVVSPACGIADGIELGLEYTRPETRDEVQAEAGVALKWVPDSWKTQTPVGDLNFGLKFSAGYQKPAGAGWQSVDRGVLMLATLVPNERWAVHTDLGVTYDQASKTSGSVLNMAVSWTPHDSWLLFAEAQTNGKQEILGKTVTSTGVRYWLTPDVLGLDLTASHQSGRPTVWTFGLGWYGLFK